MTFCRKYNPCFNERYYQILMVKTNKGVKAF